MLPRLREAARASLTFAFLPGESLTRMPACAGADPSAEPSVACATLIAASAKAREQWRLERALARFEAEIGHDPF